MKKIIFSLILAVTTTASANDIVSNIVTGIGNDTSGSILPNGWLDSNDEAMSELKNGFVMKRDVFIVCTSKGGTIYVRNTEGYDDGSGDLVEVGKITPDQCGFDG